MDLSSNDVFLAAGPTQTAEEPVDHLRSTENDLQGAGGQQSAEQADVKLDNVAGFCAYEPLWAVRQVTFLTVEKHILKESFKFNNYVKKIGAKATPLRLWAIKPLS